MKLKDFNPSTIAKAALSAFRIRTLASKESKGAYSYVSRRGISFCPGLVHIVVGESQMLAKHELHSAGRVVLVVDDDLQVLKLTCQMLAAAGYQPVEATTAAEALAIATQIKLDVFLVDAILPGISGPDLADELAQSQGEAKIVFMSGLDPLAVWVAFGKPCQVLRKPFTREELIRKIETPETAALDVADLILVDELRQGGSGL